MRGRIAGAVGVVAALAMMEVGLAQTIGPLATVQKGPIAVDLMFLRTDAVERDYELVAVIRNSSGQSREGVILRMDALDQDGVLVGSWSEPLPPIVAGGSFTLVKYWASALKGARHSVNLVIENEGKVSSRPFVTFPVDGVTLVEERSPYRRGRTEFRASGNATVGAEEVRRLDLGVVAILRDGSGNIIGAKAYIAPFGLPEWLAPGSKFKIELPYIAAATAPATTEVAAYIRR